MTNLKQKLAMITSAPGALLYLVILFSGVFFCLLQSQFEYSLVDSQNMMTLFVSIKLILCVLLLLFIGLVNHIQIDRLIQRKIFSWHWPVFLVIQVIDSALLLSQPDVYHNHIRTMTLIATSLLVVSYINRFPTNRITEIVLSASLIGVSGLVLLLVVQWPAKTMVWQDPLALVALLACSTLMAASWLLLKKGPQANYPVYLIPLVVGLIGFYETFGGGLLGFRWGAILSYLVLFALLSSVGWAMNGLIARYMLMFHQSLNSNPSVCFCSNLNGRLLFVNSAFRRLFSVSEKVPITAISHPFVRHPQWPQIQSQLAKGLEWSGETTLKAGDGKMISVFMELVPVHEGNSRWYRATLVSLEEKIELLEQRATAEEKLERLSFNLLEKQEEERRYFAKELHDEIGQGLTLIKIQHQLPEPDQQLIKHVLSELIDKVRNLSLNLRPAILDDMGLSAALDWLVGRQRKFSRLEIKAEIATDIPRISDKIEISVFRIAQEAFTNIHKYAHAQHVDFCCYIENDSLKLIIKDDGIGFDVEAKFNRATQSQSLGLVSIKERAFLIHGQVKIESSPEQGTAIELFIPLADRNDAL